MDPNIALFLLLIVGPLSLVLAKLGNPASRWLKVWFITALVSWAVVNYSLWLDPPNNGLAYGVSFLLGWIWALPVTGVLWLFQALLFRIKPSLRTSQTLQRSCRVGATLTQVLAGLLIVCSLFGWISADRAIAIAAHHFSRQGRVPTGTPKAVWSWSHWTIRYSDSESGPYLKLSRAGALIDGSNGAAPKPGTAENSPPQTEGKVPSKERELIRAAMFKHGIPGASIAVIDHHELAWAAGFGVRGKTNPQPVDLNTVFQAASVSKPACAMAVMLLAERKKLQLDTDVNLMLRSWQVPASNAAGGERVTLRRLLSHSASVSVHGFYGYGPGKPVPSLLQVLQGKPPANSSPVVIERKPGAAFQYSGGGYCIVQQLLVDLEKRSFEDIMNDLVLKPCGMPHSSYAQPLIGTLCENQATGHHSNGEVVAGGFHVYPEQAAAGLWTTAADYARLLIAIDHAFNQTGSSPFSKAMLEQIMTAQKGNYGLGWELGTDHGKPTLSHGGANEGFRCYVWLCPEQGKGFVALTNSDKGMSFIEDIQESLASPIRR